VRQRLQDSSSLISKGYMTSCLTRHDCTSSQSVAFLHISGTLLLTNIFSVFVHLDWYFPGTSFTPPFDRHDWVVRRPSTNEEVRYVIDYYSSRKRIGGEPVFHLDVRPALDSFDNTKLRVTVAIEHLLSRVHAPQLHINTVKLTWCIYGLLFCFVLLECM